MNYLENNVTKVNNSHCNSTSVENFYIGYSTENSVAWFTVLSTLGIIVNLSFIGYYLVKKWIRKSQQKSTRVSKIQNIFTLLSVFELFISIFPAPNSKDNLLEFKNSIFVLPAPLEI